MPRNREQAQIHYQQNKEAYKEAAKKRRKLLAEWLSSLKVGKKCNNCDENEPACLEYHHRNPSEKEFNISSMSIRTYSKAKVQSELDKCDLLCANCHRKLHKYGSLSNYHGKVMPNAGEEYIPS